MARPKPPKADARRVSFYLNLNYPAHRALYHAIERAKEQGATAGDYVLELHAHFTGTDSPRARPTDMRRLVQENQRLNDDMRATLQEQKRMLEEMRASGAYLPQQVDRFAQSIDEGYAILSDTDHMTFDLEDDE